MIYILKIIFFFFIEDNLILCDLLAKQITHLKIDIKTKTPRWSETVSKIFDLILSLCKKLTVLNFCDMFRKRKCWTPISYRPSGYISSTLIKLKINVASLFDFLFLLDGRLNSLTTLIIHVSDIFETPIDIHHAVSIISIIVLFRKINTKVRNILDFFFFIETSF